MTIQMPYTDSVDQQLQHVKDNATLTEDIAQGSVLKSMQGMQMLVHNTHNSQPEAVEGLIP